MKQIVCEMCESTEFLKEDGMFICQGCGMRYSTEEAKKLMVEIDGAAPKSGAMDKIANMLTLARNAIDQSNNSEAEDYANRILEIDSTNAEAWLIKGQAVGWQSKVRDIRFSEMASCFEHALEHASEEEIDAFKETIKNNCEHVAKALLKLTTDNFSNYPSTDNVTDIQSATSAMLSLTMKVLLMHVNWDQEGLDDFFSMKINEAAVAGSNKADSEFGPDNSDKNKYAYERWLNENDNCIALLHHALVFAKTQARIKAIAKNYEILQENAIGSCSYKFEATGYWSGYVKDLSLTEAAKNSRRTSIKDFQKKADKKLQEINEKARQKAEAEQKAKNEAYWQAHAEEKQALENEKAELTNRISVLEAEIKGIQEKNAPEIKKLQAKLRETLPEEKAVADQEAVIASLTAERRTLGLFKGKEKKALDARIKDEETPKLDSLTAAAKAKRMVVNSGINEQLTVLKKEDAAKKQELKDAQNRLKEIDRELTKNR